MKMYYKVPIDINMCANIKIVVDDMVTIITDTLLKGTNNEALTNSFKLRMN